MEYDLWNCSLKAAKDDTAEEAVPLPWTVYDKDEQQQRATASSGSSARWPDTILRSVVVL